MTVNNGATLLGISALSHRGLGPVPLTMLSRAVGPGTNLKIIYSLWSLGDRSLGHDLPMVAIL